MFCYRISTRLINILSEHPFVYFVCVFVCLFVRLFVCLFYLFIYLFIYLFVCLFVCCLLLFVCLFVCLFVLFVCFSTFFCLKLYFFTFPNVFLSAYKRNNNEILKHALEAIWSRDIALLKRNWKTTAVNQVDNFQRTVIFCFFLVFLFVCDY